MHKNLRRAAFALMGGLALSTTSLAAETAQTVDDQDAYRHLIGTAPFVEGPWQDLTASGGGNPFWMFRLTVDATGQVVDATWKAGPDSQRTDAGRVAKALRFRPFQRDGHDVPARFDFVLHGRAGDYAGPPDRAFPAHIDPARLRIALDRTACFGTCPNYRVEVHGDGEVIYLGRHDVLIEGEHPWHVPPASLAPLIALLRQSDYFKLDGYYQAGITDNPSYTTRVDTGTQRKFVYDYAGRMLKEESPSTPGQAAHAMPESVTAIEDAIDAVSGATSWVRGDEHTMAALQAAPWDFHAPAASHAVLQLVRDCKVPLALAFLQAGAPVDATPGLLGTAAYCGDLGLVAMLESRGALARQDNADEFLEDAAGNGYPDFVALALKHGARAAHADREGTPVITRAAQASPRDDRRHGDAVFDPARAIALLVAAGADPNASDKDGNRPLHSVSSAANARALVAAGADPAARNAHRQTPLFVLYDADAVPVFLAMGADANAIDDEGRTPLETTTSEHVAQALLAAGARWPTDPKHLSELVNHAVGMSWRTLLPLIRQKSGAAGNPARQLSD